MKAIPRRQRRAAPERAWGSRRSFFVRARICGAPCLRRHRLVGNPLCTMHPGACCIISHTLYHIIWSAVQQQDLADSHFCRRRWQRRFVTSYRGRQCFNTARQTRAQIFACGSSSSLRLHCAAQAYSQVETGACSETLASASAHRARAIARTKEWAMAHQSWLLKSFL